MDQHQQPMPTCTIFLFIYSQHDQIIGFLRVPIVNYSTIQGALLNEQPHGITPNPTTQGNSKQIPRRNKGRDSTETVTEQ